MNTSQNVSATKRVTDMDLQTFGSGSLTLKLFKSLLVCQKGAYPISLLTNDSNYLESPTHFQPTIPESKQQFVLVG